MGAGEQGNSGPPRPEGVGIRGNRGAGEDEGDEGDEGDNSSLLTIYQCPMPHAPCPNAPMPHALKAFLTVDAVLLNDFYVQSSILQRTNGGNSSFCAGDGGNDGNFVS